jgi:hypothetical protein
MLIGHLGDEIKMHYFDGGNCIGDSTTPMKFTQNAERKNHFYRVA